MNGANGTNHRVPVSVDPYRPEGYDVWPGWTDCFKTLRSMLKGTVQVSDLSPHIHRPWNSRSICVRQRAVINIPAAFDAAANAGGIALAAAAGAIEPVPIFTPSAAAPPFEPLQIFEFTSAPGHATVINQWGITVANSEPEAASVFADIQGPSQGADAPDALISGATAREHQPTLIVLPDNKRMRISVQNLDTGSAILVTFSFCGWVINTGSFKDTLESLLPNPGFGLECDQR